MLAVIWRMTTLGQILRQARERLGISQAEMARRLKVSRAIVSRWEKDEAAPKRRRAPAVAKLLGIPLNSVDPLSTPGVIQVDAETLERQIPVLEWETLPMVRSEGGARLRGRSYIYAENNLPDDCVALRVNDDSMAPEFLSGDLIIVSDTVKPSDGDHAVAVIDDKISILRQIRIRGKDKFGADAYDLLCVSPDYPTLTINSANPVKGLYIVLEHRRRRRRE